MFHSYLKYARELTPRIDILPKFKVSNCKKAGNKCQGRKSELGTRFSKVDSVMEFAGNWVTIYGQTVISKRGRHAQRRGGCRWAVKHKSTAAGLAVLSTLDFGPALNSGLHRQGAEFLLVSGFASNARFKRSILSPLRRKEKQSLGRCAAACPAASPIRPFSSTCNVVFGFVVAVSRLLLLKQLTGYVQPELVVCSP